jgi:hypothetical protein
MNLSYPVKPYVVNQHFGNKDPKYTGLGLVGHNGVDLRTWHGQPVYAAHDGIAVHEVDDKGGWGVVVRDEREGFKTIYWHFCNSVKEPQFKSPLEGLGDVVVKRGDLIGHADNTGLSTGDHLHFGKKLIAQGEPGGAWYNVDQHNGYMGAIDPEPYFDGTYAEDVNKDYLEKDLGFGSFGSEVSKLQVFLIAKKLLGTGVFGFFGVKTLGAVRQFQSQNKLPVTGFVGPTTRKVINSIMK